MEIRQGPQGVVRAVIWGKKPMRSGMALGKSTDLSESLFPHMKKEEPGDFQVPFPFCTSMDEDQERVP